MCEWNCEFCRRIQDIEQTIGAYRRVLGNVELVSKNEMSTLDQALRGIEFSLDSYMKSDTIDDVKLAIDSLDDEMKNACENIKSFVGNRISAFETEKASASIQAQEYHAQQEALKQQNAEKELDNQVSS